MKSNYFFLFILMFYCNFVFSLAESNSLFTTNQIRLGWLKEVSEMPSEPQKFKDMKGSKIEDFKFLEMSGNYPRERLSSWLKYLEIRQTDNQIPTKFRQNKMYYRQKFNGNDQNNTGRVPSGDYFYFELKNDEIYVYTSNSGVYRQLVQTLSISNIAVETSTSPCRGGIEDVGNFSEGYCFMLKFNKGQRRFIWEICADSQQVKQAWMRAILSQVRQQTGTSGIPQQKKSLFNKHTNNNFETSVPVRSINAPIAISKSISQEVMSPGSFSHITRSEVITGYTLKSDWSPCSKPCGEGMQIRTLQCIQLDKCSSDLVQRRICNIKKCKEDLENHLKKLEMVAQGRWDYLGNWSPCSKPCGGGSQTIKRVCIGGDCLGEAILSKPCNIFNCQNETKVIKKETGVLSQCKNLHGEFKLLVQQAPNYMPTTVEINMNNIEVFATNNSAKPMAILQLNSLNTIQISQKYPGCMKLGDNSGRIRLCSNNCSQWVEKIKDFRNRCSNMALDKIVNEIVSSSSSNEDPIMKIDKLQQQLQSKQGIENKIKERQLELQFEEFKKQANSVIAKEEAYEKKLQNEEKNRIECEEKKLNKAIVKEEQVAKKILNDIETLVKTENAYKMKENTIKRQMKGIMKEVKNKILNKRVNLINNIQTLRNCHKNNQKEAMKKLIKTKKAIAQRLTSLKSGSASKCYEKIKDSYFIANYCNLNFSDPGLKSECLKETQFCFLCCDKEIGVNNKSDLDCCYKKCENKQSQQCESFYSETSHISVLGSGYDAI